MKQLACHTITVIAAIAAIAWMQHEALARGVDGTVLMTAIAAIAGLAGYQVRAATSKTQPPVPVEPPPGSPQA